jgi:hypothetical protein
MPSKALVSGKSGFSFSTVFSTLSSRNSVAVSVWLMLLLAAWPAAAAKAKITTTTALTVTATNGAVTSVPYGTTVTLTATVTPASSSITTGQVNFCDGGVTYCEDVHIIGTAQITSAGTATIKVHPVPGSYSYEAVFVGTTAFTGSTSSVSDLAVTGEYPSSTQIALAGTTGTFALTATVHGSAKTGATPTGTVAFTDTTASNAVLGTALLGGGTTSLLGDVTGGALRTMGPYTVAAGDFNGDGIQDLVVDQGLSLAVLLGDGTGNFTAAPGSPISIGSINPNPAAVVVADFNGDGIPDILVAVSTGIEILLGNGNGTFTQATGSPVSVYLPPFSYAPANGMGVTPVVVADFNGDGIPDFAVLLQNAGPVVYLGNGDGSFQTTPLTPSSAPPAQFASAVVGDFNGDGIPDVVAQSTYGPVFLFLGNGDGSSQAGTEIASNSTAGLGLLFPTSIAAGDFNADGNLDLAIPNGSSVNILPGNGNGTFQAATSVPFPSPVNSSGDTSYVIRVSVGDFNGDGVPDLLMGGVTDFYGLSGGGPVIVALGNGNGTFTRSTATIPNAPCCYASVLADFNGDGLTDVVTPSYVGNLAQVLFANDAMATATNSNITAAGAASDLVVAQYPGDGNYLSSTSTPIELIEAPTFNPPGGTYSSTEEVQISSGTPNTTIYYTTNGQPPQKRAPSIEYTGQIDVNVSETINAIAYSADGSASAMSSATYVVPSPTPTITSLSPTGLNTGNVDYLVSVTGTGYTSGSTVMWGSTALNTTYQSSTGLSAEFPAALLKTEGTASVTVVTPAPGGGTSNAETFTVSAVVPMISSISPTSVTAGSATFPLTVTAIGVTFTTESTVMWGSTALATTFVNVAELTAQVPAALVATQGGATVTVVSPAPGGGTSGAETFTINAAPLAPTVNGISPTTATAGAAAFPLTVNGANFTNASTVMWGTTSLGTGYVSASELQVTVPAALVAAEGTISVTVVTPAPGGGTSGGSTFTVTALAPTVSGISPTNITAGSATFPLTVSGANFTAASTVMWGTAALATTFVSSTEVTAQVAAALVAEGGTAAVTVVSPAPGGGTSGAETFTINGAPLPAVSGISPGLAVAGAAAFQLTVTGTNFTNASVVMWGSTALTTTYVSPTELTAQVTATEVAAAGTLRVTVVTPAPGGGTSNAYVFEVDTAGSTAPTFATTSVTVTAGGAGTYGVTLPSTATNVSVTCLNLPAGATCGYSGGVLTINTTGTTPTGTFVITAVFTETLPGAASAVVLLPFLLLPFAGAKRRRKLGMMVAGLVVLAVAVVASGGCGGGGGGGGYTPPAPTTHTVSSSGAVTLVVH